IACFYLPMTVLGWKTIERRPYAPRAGLILTLVFLGIPISGFMGMPVSDVGGVVNDSVSHLAVNLFFTMLIGVQALAYVLALIALSAERSAGKVHRIHRVLPRSPHPGAPPQEGREL